MRSGPKWLPSMREHADRIQEQRDQHPPEAVVPLNLTDDVYLRSYNWARLELGIPLPPQER